jgi:fatty-acyl-CoA synthase
MPEKSAETLRADGWLRTGDLATMAERGCCWIVGRLKDTIIARRESLPRRDRRGLLPPTAVAEVAVVGLPDERWGEALDVLASIPA